MRDGASSDARVADAAFRPDGVVAARLGSELHPLIRPRAGADHCRRTTTNRERKCRGDR